MFSIETILYAGDLGTLNYKKRHRRSRWTNQEVGALEFGQLEAYLAYKLRRHGIQRIKMNETYTYTITVQLYPMNGILLIYTICIKKKVARWQPFFLFFFRH